ncbi:MAG: outer membrane lipid asymmetry maintenance protein MlaD [Chthoniobacterales bacterium]|nr:outer membrane lipid asymmetry maintenance protein MlaD [Chthoniobacterales bacterium]
MTTDQRLEIGVGLFMLAGLAAVVYLTLKLGAGALVGAETYPLEARFANTGGLNKGGSVVLGGVTVGRIEGIRLDPSDYSAIVEMSVLSDVRLPSDTMASIKTSGLLGDKFVALAPGAEEECLKPSDRILMTESAVELESLISKMAFGSVKEGQGTQTAASGAGTEPQP